MAFRAFVLGASGYGGGELLRLLSEHPECSGFRGTSRQNAGELFSKVHPNLRSLGTHRFDAEIDSDWLAESEHPVVFAAYPHGVLSKSIHDLESRLPSHARVIDLSADFRIQETDLYKKYYGVKHPSADLLPQWQYGLPEINRRDLPGSKRISNPGCFATAIELGIWPLVKSRSDVKQVFVSGMTGSSGSGVVPSDTTHHPSRANDLRAYKVLQHQHLAEITQLTKGKLVVNFVPHSAPIVRGIFATIQFEIDEKTPIRSLFEETYINEPFIQIVEGSPRLIAVNGSNFVEIGIFQQGRSCAILVALDNLGKGMASQAIQNMNVSFGYPETLGILRPSQFPA